MIYRGLVLRRKPGSESKNRAPFLNTRAKIISNALAPSCPSSLCGTVTVLQPGTTKIFLPSHNSQP